MKRGISLLAAVLLIAGSAGAGTEDAREIIRRADELLRGKTQIGTYRMDVIRPDWRRTLRFKFWSEGLDRSFILVLEPAKERGVTFLKIKNEMWNYIPRINRVIKIPPSMMMQSWMGSDFANDDLVKESNIVRDYQHELVGVDTLDGQITYHVVLRPRPEAAVVWDRIEYWIRKKDFVPLRADYFNERGEKVRVLLFSDIKRMSGRVLPTRMELRVTRKPQNRTVLILEDVVFDKPVPRSVFTKSFLRRAR